MDVRICSWNIWGGKYMPQVTDFLRRESFDVIALQEVEETGDGGHGAQTIAEALGYSCVYARSMEYAKDGGMHAYRGNALLTRAPIEHHAEYTLSRKQPRTAVRADIRAGNRMLHVTTAHLLPAREPLSARIQEEQAAALVSASPNECAVILGDFNALPESGTIARMTEVFRNTDAHGLPSWCLYPDGGDRPQQGEVRWKLDYIFVTRDIAFRDFRVETSTGSDHLPVSVVLTLP